MRKFTKNQADSSETPLLGIIPIENIKFDLKDRIAQRKQHSAVESAIHALQNHSLDRCPDKGQNHFDRYALLGVLACNIHNLGKLMLKKYKSAA